MDKNGNIFHTHLHIKFSLISFSLNFILRIINTVNPTATKNYSFFIPNNINNSLQEQYWNDEHNYSKSSYKAPLFNGSLYHTGINIPESSADDYSDSNAFGSMPNIDTKIYSPLNKNLSNSYTFNCLVRPWYPIIYSKTAYDGQLDPNLGSDPYFNQNSLNESIYSDVEHSPSVTVSYIKYPPLLTQAAPQLGMEACEIYQANSCCSAEQADELMLPVRSHSGYRWDLCGPPKRECNRVMAELECFYECSPYISSWYGNLKGKENTVNLELSATNQIRGVPLCAEFCELWFSSCIKEKTCAKDGNWVSGHKFVLNESRCLEGAYCSYFNEVYANAETMCNTLWGTRYKFESDTTKCFDPRKVHDHDRIWKLLKNKATLSFSDKSKNYIAVYCVILFLKNFV